MTNLTGFAIPSVALPGSINLRVAGIIALEPTKRLSILVEQLWLQL